MYRDTSVSLTYRRISDTTYSCRHALSIKWTNVQQTALDFSLPNVSIEWSSPGTLLLTMRGVSAASENQSEAYIATLALFLLCSTSPTDDKVFLRLPQNWRDLYKEFEQIRKEQNVAKAIEDTKQLRGLIQHRRNQEDEESVVISAAFRNRIKIKHEKVLDGQKDRNAQTPSMADNVQHQWMQVTASSGYQRMLPTRRHLPISQYKAEILETIQKSQLTIVCGETGCGKSTQLPSFLLEDALLHGVVPKIYCTEPRRISAISLAQRVSEELGEPTSAIGTASSLVGYAIRLESQFSENTRLIYATVGIVLRMLESSNTLEGITHLIIDEVHERR
jgi:ATP-dependent RNA helicase DHX29